MSPGPCLKTKQNKTKLYIIFTYSFENFIRGCNMLDHPLSPVSAAYVDICVEPSVGTWPAC